MSFSASNIPSNASNPSQISQANKRITTTLSKLDCSHFSQEAYISRLIKSRFSVTSELDGTVLGGIKSGFAKITKPGGGDYDSIIDTSIAEGAMKALLTKEELAQLELDIVEVAGAWNGFAKGKEEVGDNINDRVAVALRKITNGGAKTLSLAEQTGQPQEPLPTAYDRPRNLPSPAQPHRGTGRFFKRK